MDSTSESESCETVIAESLEFVDSCSILTGLTQIRHLGQEESRSSQNPDESKTTCSYVLPLNKDENFKASHQIEDDDSTEISSQQSEKSQSIFTQRLPGKRKSPDIALPLSPVLDKTPAMKISRLTEDTIDSASTHLSEQSHHGEFPVDAQSQPSASSIVLSLPKMMQTQSSETTFPSPQDITQEADHPPASVSERLIDSMYSATLLATHDSLDTTTKPGNKINDRDFEIDPSQNDGVSILHETDNPSLPVMVQRQHTPTTASHTSSSSSRAQPGHGPSQEVTDHTQSYNLKEPLTKSTDRWSTRIVHKQCTPTTAPHTTSSSSRAQSGHGPIQEATDHTLSSNLKEPLTRSTEPQATRIDISTTPPQNINPQRQGNLSSGSHINDRLASGTALPPHQEQSPGDGGPQRDKDDLSLDEMEKAQVEMRQKMHSCDENSTEEIKKSLREMQVRLRSISSRQRENRCQLIAKLKQRVSSSTCSSQSWQQQQEEARSRLHLMTKRQQRLLALLKSHKQLAAAVHLEKQASQQSQTSGHTSKESAHESHQLHLGDVTPNNQSSHPLEGNTPSVSVGKELSVEPPNSSAHQPFTSQHQVMIPLSQILQTPVLTRPNAETTLVRAFKPPFKLSQTQDVLPRPIISLVGDSQTGVLKLDRAKTGLDDGTIQEKPKGTTRVILLSTTGKPSEKEHPQGVLISEPGPNTALGGTSSSATVANNTPINQPQSHSDTSSDLFLSETTGVLVKRGTLDGAHRQNQDATLKMSTTSKESSTGRSQTVPVLNAVQPMMVTKTSQEAPMNTKTVSPQYITSLLTVVSTVANSKLPSSTGAFLTPAASAPRPASKASAAYPQRNVPDSGSQSQPLSQHKGPVCAKTTATTTRAVTTVVTSSGFFKKMPLCSITQSIPPEEDVPTLQDLLQKHLIQPGDNVLKIEVKRGSDSVTASIHPDGTVSSAFKSKIFSHVSLYQLLSAVKRKSIKAIKKTSSTWKSVFYAGKSLDTLHREYKALTMRGLHQPSQSSSATRVVYQVPVTPTVTRLSNYLSSQAPPRGVTMCPQPTPSTASQHKPAAALSVASNLASLKGCDHGSKSRDLTASVGHHAVPPSASRPHSASSSSSSGSLVASLERVLLISDDELMPASLGVSPNFWSTDDIRNASMAPEWIRDLDVWT